MSLRRCLAAALVAAVIGIPTIALAGSGDAPAPPSASPTTDASPADTTATADPARATTTSTASAPSTEEPAVTPDPAAPGNDVASRPAVDRVQPLRLACTPVRADTEPPDVHRRGILCRWSPSTHDLFAGYRLWRGDGEHREVIFRTDDRDATRHLDIDVEPGGTYLYLIEALTESGRVIGRGGPVKVAFPKPPREELRLACEPVATDAGRGIACKWSETQHPDARGYVLYRSVDGGPRETIHKGGLDQTRFLDTEVRPGHRFTYAVVVVNEAGEPLGGGGPVVVGLSP